MSATQVPREGGDGGRDYELVGLAREILVLITLLLLTGLAVHYVLTGSIHSYRTMIMASVLSIVADQLT